MPRESAEDVVTRVLEPDERILWCGRPDVEVLLRSLARKHSWRWRRPMVFLAPIALTGVLLWPLKDQLPFIPVLGAGFVYVAFVLLMRSLEEKICRRWAEVLTYALTDRRLLILEQGITDDYAPGQLMDVLQLSEREPGFADIVFDHKTLADERSRWRYKRDPRRFLMISNRWIHRERIEKAFKALPDAPSVKARIEEWVKAHREDAEDALERFVANTVEPALASDDRNVSATAVLGADVTHIKNPEIGLSIDLPDEWKIQVRGRLGAAGGSAFDVIDWRDLGDAEMWRVLSAEAPFAASIEVELADTPELALTLKKVTGGVMGFVYRLLGGRTVDLDENVTRGDFVGYSLTRRLVSREPGAKHLQRHLVLHDGRRQLVVKTQWEEGSRIQEQALDAIVDSLKVS